MRTYLTAIILLLVCAAAARAQSWSEVISSGKYFYGEAKGANMAEANRDAMAMLLSQIKANVKVDTGIRNNRVEQNGKVVSDNTTFAATVEIVSEATLEETQMVVFETEPECHVGRWIAKSDLNKIYEGRRRKIEGYIDSGDRALSKGKIDVALRSYYWAFMLTKSMRLAGQEEYDGHTLMTWLPERIEDILSEVKAVVARREGDEVDIYFTYRGAPVSSIDYTYSDGGVWSNLCTAVDGYDRMEFSPNTSHEQYNISIEYQYKGQSRIDAEVAGVMAVGGESVIPRSFKTIRPEPQATAASIPATAIAPGQKAEEIAAATPVAAEAPRKSAFSDIDEDNYRRPEPMTGSSTDIYKSMMDTVLTSILSRTYKVPRHMFTDAGYSKYRRLVKYGNSKLTGTPELRFTPFDGGVVVRGIQLTFSFSHGSRKHFTENMVFTFDSSKRIDNIAFGLDKASEDDILGRSTFPVENRQRIVQFMENYKTAFALQDWDYIARIFDDDAIIIRGTVIETSKRSEDNYYKNDKRIVYQRETKEQYIRHLREQSKEFINIRFNQTQVVRPVATEEVYGIQIEQDYYSNNYSDHGYLMLAVNYNDPDRPLIFVRTWQPQPDPEFGTYTIHDFPFIATENHSDTSI